MRKIVGLLLLACGLASAALAEETPEPRFHVVPGAIAGADGESTPTTVLLDRQTGQAWVLMRGERLEWAPVPFSHDRPPRLLPRLEGEPLLLRR